MNNLVSVAVAPDEFVEFLRKNILLKDIYEKIISQRAIAQAAEERSLTVTSEEIQAEADSMRRQKRLERAADTFRWLSEQMISAEDWEAGIRDRVLAKKLAESLFSKEVEKIFAQSRLDFEQILLYQIVVPYQKVAQELFYQIEESEISFYEAAHLYDIDEQRRQHCGFEGKLNRLSLKPDIAAAVLNAEPGEIIGPIKTEQGYHLLLIQEFIPATLTPELQQQLINKMFKEWLANELNYIIHNQAYQQSVTE